MNRFKMLFIVCMVLIVLAACSSEGSKEHGTDRKNDSPSEQQVEKAAPKDKSSKPEGNDGDPVDEKENDDKKSADSEADKESTSEKDPIKVTPYKNTLYLSVSAGNVRKGPGTNHEAVDTILFGSKLKAFEKAMNGETVWYHVTYGENKEGWVSSVILSKEKPQKTAPKEQTASNNKSNSDVQQETQEEAQPGQEKSYIDLLLAKVRNNRNVQQVMIVTNSSASSYHAELHAYEIRGGRWEKVYHMPAVFGKRGVSFNRREGSMQSPAGIFSIGKSFGTVSKPSGVSLPYKKTTKYDYWVDDVTSKDYNKWIVYKGDPNKRWKSFERLRIPLYKYAMVIRYNTNPIVKGRGSAIFLHVWRSSNNYTAGCTAVSEANMLKLLRWVNPGKNPVIIQGSTHQLKALSK